MIGWAIDYMYQNNIVASNSIEATEALSDLSIIKNGFDNSVYLPNYYQLPSRSINYFKVYFSKLLRWIGFTDKPIKTVLNIGCFGAIRPLKNHLSQWLFQLLTPWRKLAEVQYLFLKQLCPHSFFHSIVDIILPVCHLNASSGIVMKL